MIDHERNNAGPNGGVSNRILGFAIVDDQKVPVLISVYADRRIDGVVESFMADSEAERTRQERYEAFLDAQPIESRAVTSGDA